MSNKIIDARAYQNLFDQYFKSRKFSRLIESEGFKSEKLGQCLDSSGFKESRMNSLFKQHEVVCTHGIVLGRPRDFSKLNSREAEIKAQVDAGLAHICSKI